MADVHQAGQHELPHLLRLEAEVLPGDPAPGHAGQGEDVLDELLRMLHGVVPALEGGPLEGLCHFRVRLREAAGGEEQVAVEVHAVVDRPDGEGLDAPGAQGEGLVGEVGGQGLYTPLDEVVQVPGVGDHAEGGGLHPFGLEHGPGLGLALVSGEHYRLARQVRRLGDAAAAPHQEDIGGVLEDHAQRHQGVPLLVGLEHLHVADPELGLAPLDHVQRQAGGSGLPEGHLQAGRGIVALELRSVVAGELELVGPLELEGHLSGRGSPEARGGRQRQEEDGATEREGEGRWHG